MAEFAEVFYLLILMLKTEDLARIWNLVYLGGIHLGARVHGVERADSRRLVDVDHTLPLVERVAHSLRSWTVAGLAHLAHSIVNHWLLHGSATTAASRRPTH